MSELYMMVTITNRQLTRKFVECYKEKGATGAAVLPSAWEPRRMRS